MLLRWRQTGRANHKAADGQGGTTPSIAGCPARSATGVWLINYIPAGWPEDQSTPPARWSGNPGSSTRYR